MSYRALNLMLHIAYLEPDYIPFSLVTELLGEPN